MPLDSGGQGSAGFSTRGKVFALRVHTSGANPMERADLYRVYDLGASLRPLLAVKEGDTLSKVYGPLTGAQHALNQLLGPTPQTKVDLCMQAALELKAIIDGFEHAHFTDKKTGLFTYPSDASTRAIEPWIVWQLESAYRNFEAVFRAEMQNAATYWVPKRGSYSTRDMVDSFDRSFLPELHESIGDKALSEYRNAGRCYAFGLWSATGYHACRAVEAVLRPYYCLLTGKNDKDAKTWGDLIKELKARTEEPKASEKAIFYLQQLKDNERNPLMHVRVVLDEQDADVLLNSSKIVIVLIAREMLNLKNAKASKSSNALLEHATKQALLEVVKNDKAAG